MSQHESNNVVVEVSEKQNRAAARKDYEFYHNTTLSNSYDTHHVVPVRMGGTNDIENLVALTVEEHAQAHLDLYHKYGNSRDLCAYHMILGRAGISPEQRLVNSATAGHVAQTNIKARGDLTGFQTFSAEKRREIASRAGTIGGTKQRDLGLGFHGMTAERSREVCSMGGHASCAVNGWRDPAVQAENGKRGGMKNKGSRYYTDGTNTFKYTTLHQSLESFDDFLMRNPHLRKGRTL